MAKESHADEETEGELTWAHCGYEHGASVWLLGCDEEPFQSTLNGSLGTVTWPNDPVITDNEGRVMVPVTVDGKAYVVHGSFVRMCPSSRTSVDSSCPSHGDPTQASAAGFSRRLTVGSSPSQPQASSGLQPQAFQTSGGLEASPDRQVAPLEHDVLLTQASPGKYVANVDEVENSAAEEYAELVEKVRGSVDPSVDARRSLQVTAQLAWMEAAGSRVEVENLAVAIARASVEDQERFHHAWTKLTYDVRSVYHATDFHKKLPSVSPRAFVQGVVKDFYDQLLAGGGQPPLEAQSATPLDAMCPKVIAAACRRVSVGCGLPPDGLLVQQAFQGQCAFYFNGPEGSMKIPPLGEDSESAWNTGATRLPLIAEGDSTAGKDNLKEIIMGWLEALSSEGLPATNAFQQGNITTTGVLTFLQENSGQVQIINSELEKVLNVTKKDKMQEADVIELLDGSPAFGKATGQQIVCLKPVAWMCLCTQKNIYAKNMGSDSCGRLRFVMLSINAQQSRGCAFEEKLVPWRKSNELLTEVMREILLFQNAPLPPQAPAVPAAGPPADTAAGSAANSAAGPTAESAAGFVAGLTPLLALADQAPSPSVQQPPPEVPPAAAGESQGPSGRAPGTGGPAKRRRKSLPTPVEETPGDAPATVMHVQRVEWSNAATLVFAGVCDGANAACAVSPNGELNSVVTKHAGKAFAACSAANVAARNGLLRFALGRDAPVDNRIRLLDALTAVPKIQLFSANQLAAERAVQEANGASKGAGRSASDVPLVAEPPLALSGMDFACRRLFDALAEDSTEVNFPGVPHRTKLWDVAITDGVPLKISGGTPWFNFRQMFFTRKRKDVPALQRYGGVANLVAHGAAPKWKCVLAHLVEQSAGKLEDGKVTIRVPEGCRAWLASLRLGPTAVAKLAAAFAERDRLT